ncbi:uncharacterized protein B0H64DRAFT_74750 [Chaetomium fimeti]|uniref:Uncharacterized protein n=1 Tax=Chaetomium fimeti TaxID=1854472 RepID=A0AAE0LUX0_9PEZI|nr:hypothetical protein B0H64DRAFT_74750 [Chaetomium fimeti]
MQISRPSSRKHQQPALHAAPKQESLPATMSHLLTSKAYAATPSSYAGPELEYVVQFLLESLALKTEVTSQVNEVYGSLAPKMSFEGKVGEGEGEGEPFYIYLMTRVRGVTHLDFILARNVHVGDTWYSGSLAAHRPRRPRYGHFGGRRGGLLESEHRNQRSGGYRGPSCCFVGAGQEPHGPPPTW